MSGKTRPTKAQSKPRSALAFNGLAALVGTLATHIVVLRARLG
jgi:hypothetical protein